MPFLILLVAFRFFSNGFILILIAVIGISLWFHWRPGPLPRGGQVVEVVDGDILVVSPPDKSMVQIIRLASIEAPEIAHGSSAPGQPYSAMAKQMLATEMLNQTVTLSCYERDDYNRAVCDVRRSGRSMNRALVASGLAWAKRERTEYLHDGAMSAIERGARAARRGLWADDHPQVAPWVWRQQCWKEHHCDLPSGQIAANTTSP